MKKIFFAAFFLIIVMVFLSAESEAQQMISSNLEEAKKAIAASNEIYFQAFVTGDSSLLINRYTNDCWIMAPNAPIYCGVEAALEFFKTAYHEYGLRNGQLITIEVFGDGLEFVTEEGFWKTFDRNHQLLDKGKFLVLWKKTPEGWKMFRDSFTSDQIYQQDAFLSISK